MSVNAHRDENVHASVRAAARSLNAHSNAYSLSLWYSQYSLADRPPQLCAEWALFQTGAWLSAQGRRRGHRVSRFQVLFLCLLFGGLQYLYMVPAQIYSMHVHVLLYRARSEICTMSFLRMFIFS